MVSLPNLPNVIVLYLAPIYRQTGLPLFRPILGPGDKSRMFSTTLFESNENEHFSEQRRSYFLLQVHKVVQGTQHRPFNPRSDAHQAFLRKQLLKVDNLERKYPRLNLDDERGFFEAQLLETKTTAASGP